MTIAWAEYIAAFVIFLFSHSVPLRPAVRASLVQRLGQRGFTIGYSILSLGILVWLIGAASRAPYVQLWEWSPWQNLVVLAAMGLACLVLALAVGRPNPFSFGGAHNEMFDPAQPGVLRLNRHPLLLAIGLWSFAHVVANGDLAHVVLFGFFGGFAVLGQRIIDARKQRQLGPKWKRLLSQTHQHPVVPSILATPYLPVRIITGLGGYLFLLWAHPVVLGVNPIP